MRFSGGSNSGTISCGKRTSSHNSAKRWGPVHDTILFYGGGVWNRVLQPLDKDYVERHYRHEDPRGRFQVDNLTGSGTRTGDSGKPWRNIDPTAKGRHWAVPDRGLPDWIILPVGYSEMSPQARLDVLDAQGLIYWPRRGTVPRFKRYLTSQSGAAVSDVIVDIPPLATTSKEKTGFATQKPISLYERIIRASSNEGDVVLDPFAGCATTLVAAESLDRQWVGIDIWDGAHKIVVDRLRDTAGLFGDVIYTDKPPDRTDDGETASPFLRVKVRVREPEGSRWSRAQMYEHLLDQHGPRCQGCDRVFDDPRYLELDHNTPRSDGGLNHITNRILLCGPCNKLKSNQYTLSGLRRQNKKRGYMAGSGIENPKLKQIREGRERNPGLFD